MTTASYRQENGRLVLRLEGIDLVDRVAVGEGLKVALGRAQVDIPGPLDWDGMGLTWEPVQVLADPLGRTWTPVQWTDRGTECELSTPWSQKVVTT